jgi:hypothetical protein
MSSRRRTLGLAELWEIPGLEQQPNGQGGSAAVLPLRRCAAVGGELAGQACPLLKVGEQFPGHLDFGGEELAGQVGRGHVPGPGSRRPGREAVTAQRRAGRAHLGVPERNVSPGAK